MEIQELIELRRTLHRGPELAHHEVETARAIAAHLARFAPDRLIEGLGGHGIVAEYRGRSDGPRLLFRAELDALPIPETIDLPHGSTTAGVAHKCGHDGHMAIVAGLAPLLHARRPTRGAVLLLFQPAEETGQGARLVLDNPAFAGLAPDRVFALHNLPGHPLGQVILRSGVFASASVGLALELTGDSSHAAEPHRGSSPALAVAELINGLSAAPQLHTALHEAAQVTVIHARLGQVAYGTSPGHGAVMATLRAHEASVIERLRARCLALAQDVARAHRLELAVEWVEPFPSTVNDPTAVELVAGAAADVGLETAEAPVPFPWSEDFGHFAAAHPGALVGIGAGEEHPALHSRLYDFPDAALELGRRLLLAVIHRALDGDAGAAT